MSEYITKLESLQVSRPQQQTAASVSTSHPIQGDKSPKLSPNAAEPANKEIARRAYQIYVKKGCPLGQNKQILQQVKQERWYKALVEMRRAIKNNMSENKHLP
jgi:hypothetical protein